MVQSRVTLKQIKNSNTEMIKGENKIKLIFSRYFIRYTSFKVKANNYSRQLLSSRSIQGIMGKH